MHILSDALKKCKVNKGVVSRLDVKKMTNAIKASITLSKCFELG